MIFFGSFWGCPSSLETLRSPFLILNEDRRSECKLLAEGHVSEVLAQKKSENRIDLCGYAMCEVDTVDIHLTSSNLCTCRRILSTPWWVNSNFYRGHQHPPVSYVGTRISPTANFQLPSLQPTFKLIEEDRCDPADEWCSSPKTWVTSWGHKETWKISKQNPKPTCWWQPEIR